MRHRVKSAVRAVRNGLADRKIADTEDTLVYVHIGKCGGKSLWTAIRESKIVEDRFSSVERVHIRKPPIRQHARYLVVVRNPIQRAISAFNWRYARVMTEPGQRDRFEGERDALLKYRTLSALSEALYDGDTLNPDAARNFNSIHHLRENIAFYLSDLLDAISEDQIFAVLATETLDADIHAQLGVCGVRRIHQNAHRVPSGKKQLSARAHENLKRYLAEDYTSIRRVLEMNGSSLVDRASLLG